MKLKHGSDMICAGEERLGDRVAAGWPRRCLWHPGAKNMALWLRGQEHLDRIVEETQTIVNAALAPGTDAKGTS